MSLYEATKRHRASKYDAIRERQALKIAENKQFAMEEKIRNQQSIAEAVQKEAMLRMEVGKSQEITRIIKREQDEEHRANLREFTRLNREEKAIRKDLVQRQTALTVRERQYKIEAVVNQQKIGRFKKDERNKFIGSFAQAKNLIENQLKVGFRIKQQKRVRTENRMRVEAIKQ